MKRCRSVVSLSARFVVVLVMLLGGVGIALTVAGRHASALYFHEVNQNLNASIAMYVVDRLTLMENGSVNHEALQVLAERAMTINPSVEVYLLSPEGSIVAHALPDEGLTGAQVPIDPIQRFLVRQDNDLVLGLDPRSGKDKAFSAFPISSGDRLQGYLYVVLGGAQFDAVQAEFLSSFIGRMASAGLLSILLVGGVIGYWLLARAGRPVRSLSRAVQAYTQSGFQDDAAVARVPDGVAEVAELKREISRMADQLAQQFEALETNDRLRRELLANLSHDLRTPLASLQGYLETLLIKSEGLRAEERERFVRTAHRHAMQLSRMVGELFELAKLDSGTQSVDMEPFSLAELLQDIVQDFALPALEKNVRLSVLGPDQTQNTSIQGDISLLQRVFVNLMSNALRYTPDGGAIEVVLQPLEEAVRVSVRDTGAGISETLLPRIFDRHIGESADDGHTGLGLAIVKRILELHGSVIRVTSEIGRGTCFTFSLQRAPAG